MLKDLVILTAMALGKEAIDKAGDLIDRIPANGTSEDEESEHKKEEARKAREEKWNSRFEKLGDKIENWFAQQEEKAAEREREKRSAYDEELRNLRAELPVEIQLQFKKGSYISDCEIIYPNNGGAYRVAAKVHLGKRCIELINISNRSKIAVAEENRQKYDRNGHVQESILTITSNGNLNSYATYKYGGWKEGLSVLMSPQEWHTDVEKDRNFKSVIKNKDGTIIAASGKDYGDESRKILLVKSRDIWVHAVMMELIWHADGMWSFSEAYDKYLMRANERGAHG